VHRIGTRAERRVEVAYLNDLKRVAGKTRLLYRIADAALEHPDEPVREVVFPIANEQTLRDLVAEYKAQGGAYRKPGAASHAVLVSQSLSPDPPGSAGCARFSFQQHRLSTGDPGTGGGA